MEFLLVFMLKVGSTKLGDVNSQSLTCKIGAKRRTSGCFQIAGKRGWEREVAQPRRLENFPFLIILLKLARFPLFTISSAKGFVPLQVALFRTFLLAPGVPKRSREGGREKGKKEKRWPSKMADRVGGGWYWKSLRAGEDGANTLSPGFPEEA